MKVVDAMSEDIATIDEDASIKKASRKMREMSIGCVVALRKGTPIGMITERDVTWNVAGAGLDPNKTKVSEIMSTPLVTIDPDADLIDAAKLMQQNKIRKLAVSKKNVLNGVLSAADIARNLENHVSTEIRSVLRYTFF
jgi:CBS domain-containing protein